MSCPLSNVVGVYGAGTVALPSRFDLTTVTPVSIKCLAALATGFIVCWYARHRASSHGGMHAGRLHMAHLHALPRVSRGMAASGSRRRGCSSNLMQSLGLEGCLQQLRRARKLPTGL